MNICFLDFETTGSDPYKSFPIQIGAVLIDSSSSIINVFTSYIRPPQNSQSSDVAFQIHQIESSILKNAPSAKNVIENFFEQMGTNYRFASWNISFDVSFFRKLCSDNNLMDIFDKIDYRHIDVQTICYLTAKLNIINPTIKSLDDCTKYFDVDRPDVHDALNDAYLALKIYSNLIDSLKLACGHNKSEG